MVESKPSHTHEVNESKNLTGVNKGQSSNTNKYRGNNPRKKSILDPKANTNFKGQCTEFQSHIFDLGPRASGKFARKMKELERYLGATYSDICQTYIMT